MTALVVAISFDSMIFLFLTQSMESVGVQRLHARSLEKHNIRYIPFIGDGDSSAYNNICKMKLYGLSIYIPKDECVSHVTKRMGTNLRALVRDHKGRFTLTEVNVF